MKKTRYQPNYTIPPGETLNETLEAMRMTRAELANRTGRAKKMIDEIIAGRKRPTVSGEFEVQGIFPTMSGKSDNGKWQTVSAKLGVEVSIPYKH